MLKPSHLSQLPHPPWGKVGMVYALQRIADAASFVLPTAFL